MTKRHSPSGASDCNTGGLMCARLRVGVIHVESWLRRQVVEVRFPGIHMRRAWGGLRGGKDRHDPNLAAARLPNAEVCRLGGARISSGHD